MAVAFRLTISHIQNSIEIDDKLLDYELVSIEDYSITGNISQNMYEMFLEKTKPV